VTGTYPLIAMWAHPRSLSTAFLRMMIARGDVTVVHEPLVTLVDEGEVPLPTRDGTTMTARSPGEVMAQLRDLALDRPVFFKDTLEYRYQYLFDHPEELAGITHTFIVRAPAKAISSHFAMKPTVTCPEIGYEHQYDLLCLALVHGARPPVVIEAERLLASPGSAVSAYCEAVGLPYLPHALSWQPEDRAEWRRTRQWHATAISSSGFSERDNDYPVTVENSDLLRSFYEYHLPFYQRILKHTQE
jgi:hypothetical protein